MEPIAAIARIVALAVRAAGLAAALPIECGGNAAASDAIAVVKARRIGHAHGAITGLRALLHAAATSALCIALTRRVTARATYYVG
jgi:hypothetical protein